MLTGRTVVITGGTGALGSAVLEELLERGARCHVVDRRPAEDTRCAHSDHESVVMHCGVNVTDEAAVIAVYEGIDDLWGSVHLAGGFTMAPIVDTSLEDVKQVMDLNFLTSFVCSREAVRAMRGTGNGGRIVNVVARPAVTPCGGMIAYAASKAAVASLTQCLAEEVRQDGIWVNAVAPSLFDTPANRRSMPDADHSQWPKAAEVAAAIAFLVSPDNALTSGSLMPVYGRL